MTKGLPPKKESAAGGKPPPDTPTATDVAKRFAIVSGRQIGPQRVVIYGPGGIGKSTLCSLAPNPAFVDIGKSTGHMNVSRPAGIETWQDMRDCLNSSALDNHETVVVDDATTAGEWSVANTLENVPHEKGGKVDNIEGYGFGKGYQHNFDTFIHLLADLDRHVRQGRNVVLVCHECIANVPHPMGEDFIRFEPHLQAPKSGKASIRNRVVQWADHVLFIGYDVFAKDGKAQGSGSRTIYTYETPMHVAKSRCVREALPFENPEDGRIWDMILGGVK